MNIKAGFITLLACCAGLWSSGQNISEIANSDPLIISGAIGTQNTFNYSSAGGVGTSRLNNSIYANLNFSIYGINMPFSFTYNNSGVNFTYPQFTFNISPSYKGFTLYLGQHSMQFSQYVYSIPATGIGLEYQGKNIRAGAFWGQLRKAINDDPTDPLARNPQYSRYGWGVKAGYGTASRYIDIYVFHASDRIGSIDSRWYGKVSPMDNLVIGARGRFTYKRFALSANAAMSVFTEDTQSDPLPDEVIGGWGKIFDARMSSRYRFAGDASASYGFKNFNFMAQFKIVQPNYKTLGTNYISNNVMSFGGSVSGSLFRGKMAIGANFSKQRDNLSKEQLYTTSGYVYSATLSLRLVKNLQFNAAYNGYKQLQSDGTAIVNDTVRVDRTMHSATGSLNYTLRTGPLNHSMGVSHSFNKNIDNNPFNNHATDVTTNATGVNYTMGIIPINITLNLGYNHQTSGSTDRRFTTDMITFGTSRAFLSDGSLRFSLTASYSKNKNDGNSNDSFGVSLSGAYTLKQTHQFTLAAAYNKYGQANWVDQQVQRTGGYGYSLSLNYNYSFVLLHIKKKVKEAEMQAQAQ